MQKRARILDNKNMKRLHINRRGRSDINQSGTPSFLYVRMLLTWMSMVVLDAVTGFRFELLWPMWLLLRAIAESIQMRNQHCVTTIASPAAAKVSILFVCMTATSDLICYLFIPFRMLIFLATTYVWMNVYCHAQGGFLRTIATLYGGERSQSWAILFIMSFIVAFELFVRIRITKFDYIFLFRSHPLLLSIFPIFSITEWAGIPPIWPRSLNKMFASHCIGYPIVLVTVSLHYYLNEWKLRRKQGDVSNRNEQLFRILVESLPAEYEGPKDYTASSCLDENGEMYYLDPLPSSQPMQAIAAAPPTATPPTKKNGSVHKMASSKKKKNGAYNSTPPNDKKKGKSIRSEADLDDNDDSDADDYSWREDDKKGGVWIIRTLFDVIAWAFCVLFTGVSSAATHKKSPPPPPPAPRRLTEEEDEEESTLGDEVLFEKKNGRTDSLTVTTTKSRANTMPSSTRTQNNNQNKAKNGKPSHHHHQNNHQKTNGQANGHARTTAATAIRDSSHDTNASNEADIRSMTRELETLRAELSSRRSLEDDFRLQISMRESNESRLSQQLSNMKLKVEQMEIKCSTLERHRESDKSQLEQAERKYADILGKKTEIEATLSAERKARNESAGKKIDVAEHQRERERQLESEIDKLRAELKSKEESALRTESELSSLRNYKEENDIEAINMELRLVREKSQQMEESLAGENKLKQSLFKCLGDARDTIKQLEKQIVDLRGKGGSAKDEPLMMNGHAAETNNDNDTTASDQSSPNQHSAMASPVPSAKMPLTVNVSNRGGSPPFEKISPPMAAMMLGAQPPPDYLAAVGAAAAAAAVAAQKQACGYSTIRYNEFKHMPTGEHRLFDTGPLAHSAPSPTGSNPDDDFLLSNKGKFGAPSNPATRLA
ncbi:unnamed protein product [Caenorhabditis sp. 36 PRJEB53466]|nr:unnamed protein product [Caenorhabditis sp. 36 PRJEB53466]